MGTRKIISDADRLFDRIVVLTTRELKERYYAMCEAKGLNPSEHARETWEAELAAYDAEK